MWSRRKVLLAAAVVFTALYYSVAAEKQLYMAQDAVDYLYDKCRKEAMAKLIHSGVLRQELNLSAGFQKAWSDHTQCPRLIPGAIKEHIAALWAYVDGDEDFIKTFNNQVETMGRNISTYENNFSFKSLHFLLMDYMMLQKPPNCKTVYTLADKSVEAKNGSKVRLGRFTLANLSLKELPDLDEEVVLNITSCFYVKLGKNICKEESSEVLLSPAEEFTVASVMTKKDPDSQFTEIILKHSDLKSLHSSHSCDIFSRSPAVVSTHVWLVLVLLSLSLVFIC
ncbi:ecto-ADP-ribosyltransferase 3 [Paralichthys olivaceus]|uniref:ecto-ADP-ribosyltransferase 3 n=1 Tax=Paralichthys olivaceus TaxID=8255 RepID=UPI003753D4C4